MSPVRIGTVFQNELGAGLRLIGYVWKARDVGGAMGGGKFRRFTPKSPVDFFVSIQGMFAGIEAKAIDCSDPKARWPFDRLRSKQRDELQEIRDSGGFAGIAFNLRYPRTRGVALLVPLSTYEEFEGQREAKSCRAFVLLAEFYVKFALRKGPGVWIIPASHVFWQLIGKPAAVIPVSGQFTTLLAALPTIAGEEDLQKILFFAP